MKNSTVFLRSFFKSLFGNLVFPFILSSCWPAQHLFSILDALKGSLARMTICIFQTGYKTIFLLFSAVSKDNGIKFEILLINASRLCCCKPGTICFASCSDAHRRMFFSLDSRFMGCRPDFVS